MPGISYGEYTIQDWSDLSGLLVNGWTVEAGGPNFEARVVNTRVDLRGGLVPPIVVVGKQTICTLPTNLRPPVIYNFPVGMGNSAARLTINPDGTVVFNGILTPGQFSTIYTNSIDYWLV